MQTKQHRERLAQESLHQRQLPTYLPMITQWPRPTVGSAVAPMFPGYLFVQLNLPDDFPRACWVPGAKSLVGFGGGPIPIGQDAIAFLRSREGADGRIRCGDPLEESGDGKPVEVRIINGPFRGLTAIVEQRLPARERVRVLLNILHRQTPVELPDKWVRRA